LSDVQRVLSAHRRVLEACRARELRSEDGGTVLTRHQGRILTYLDPEDPVMVTELAEYAGVTASTMSLTLKRLEEAGLVRRERDPDDRRVVNVCVTPLGASMRERARELDPQRVDALLASLRPEERRRAVEGLSLLADAADALAARYDRYVGSLTGSSE